MGGHSGHVVVGAGRRRSQDVWTPAELFGLYHNVIEVPFPERHTFIEKYREQLRGVLFGHRGTRACIQATELVAKPAPLVCRRFRVPHP
jgi:hypothetical protein